MYYITVTITKNIYESDVSRETFGYLPYYDFSLKIYTYISFVLCFIYIKFINDIISAYLK